MTFVRQSSAGKRYKEFLRNSDVSIPRSTEYRYRKRRRALDLDATITTTSAAVDDNLTGSLTM